MVLTELSSARYGKLLAKTLPQVIETKEEFDRMVNAMESLDRQESLTPEENALRKLLEHLIQEYDDQVELPNAPPYRIVLHLMERLGLRQADLVPVFGSRSVASGVLNGKREISKTHARKLAVFFHLPVSLFI